jgi:hypothetical protein
MPGTEVSPRATSSGAAASPSPGQCAGISARIDGRMSNGRFAPGNRCSRRHGKRSIAATEKRKAGATARKLAATILAKLNLLPAYRCRPRPLRPDQLRHLDPAGLAVMQRLGLG